MNLQIAFKGNNQRGGFISYEIELKDLKTNETWTFHRRYSFLRDFYSQISSSLNHSLNFPPKKLFGNKSPKFVAHRQQELETFFKNLLKHAGLQENPSIINFLYPSDRKICESAKPSVQPTKKLAEKGERIKEVRDTSQKVADLMNSKFFDLSSQPLPLEEEEYKSRERCYCEVFKGLKLEIPSNLHLKSQEIDENHAVSSGRSLERSFDSLLRAFPTPTGYQFTRKLD
jgi:hypothetical protein